MTITAITSDRFANKRWRENGNYQFAQSRMICELAVQEIPMASLSYPVAILAHEEQYHFIALLGVKQKENLFVSAEGRWLGRYIPAVLRAYPFRLTLDDNGSKILCIGEAAGVIGDEGERFYEEDGSTPSAAIREKMNFVSEVDRGMAEATRVGELLHDEGVLKTWDIQRGGGDEPPLSQQLQVVDEGQLNTLSGERLAFLRDEGALSLIYSQLSSLNNMQNLKNRAMLRDKASGETDLKGLLDVNAEAQDSLNFENL